MKKGKVKYFFSIFNIFFIFTIVFISGKAAFAQLTSVNLTLPTPTSMSDGKLYYIASSALITEYDFVVKAVHPTADDATDYDYFQVTMPTSAGNLVFRWDSDNSEGGGTIITLGGAPSTVVTVTITNDTNWPNLTVTFKVVFNWTAPDTTNASMNIIAAVKESGAPTIKTDTKSQSYGITANIKVHNFAQDGIASDTYINPIHVGFNVSGTVVYDIPGYELENASDAVADADIITVTPQLVRRTLGTVFASIVTSANAAFNQPVPGNTVTLRIYPMSSGISEVRFWCNDELIDVQRVKSSDLNIVQF